MNRLPPPQTLADKIRAGIAAHKDALARGEPWAIELAHQMDKCERPNHVPFEAEGEE